MSYRMIISQQDLFHKYQGYILYGELSCTFFLFQTPAAVHQVKRLLGENPGMVRANQKLVTKELDGK